VVNCSSLVLNFNFLLYFFRPFLFLILFNSLSAQEISVSSKLKVREASVWNLTDSIAEISGICNALPFTSTNWFLGIQDGGNSSDIVVFNWENRKSFVVSTGLNNRDWEAITRDNERVYIGDFGNNRGDRRDLKIYRISNVDSAVFAEDWKCNVTGINKRGIRNTSLVDSIEFVFEDQQDFRSRFRHNFDCESMLVNGDSIWLFTKNWKNFRSDVYLLLNKPEKQVARKIAVLKTRCLVTDVCWQNRDVFLTGYTLLGNQFLLNLQWNQMKITDRRRIGLKPAQIEGLQFNSLYRKLYISTEKRKSQSAAIIELNLNGK